MSSAQELDLRQKHLNSQIKLSHRRFCAWVQVKNNKKRLRKKSRLDIGLNAGYDPRGVLGDAPTK